MQKVERVKDRKYLKETPLTNYYFWERTKIRDERKRNNRWIHKENKTHTKNR